MESPQLEKEVHDKIVEFYLEFNAKLTAADKYDKIVELYKKVDAKLVAAANFPTSQRQIQQLCDSLMFMVELKNIINSKLEPPSLSEIKNISNQ